MAGVNGDRDQLLKASVILDFLARAANTQIWWGVREISKNVDLPVTTAHRTLGALAEIGYVRRDTSSRYAIGIELLRIARLVLNADSLVSVARPHLEQLVRQSDEAALLARHDEATNSLVFVEQILGSRKRDYEVPLYKHLSLYKGASGTSMLSYLSRGHADVVDDEVLREIRNRGVVLSRGQRIPGAVGIASPVISPEGTVVGSVTLTFPESRLPTEHRCRQLESLVWQCAQNIRHDLRVMAGAMKTTSHSLVQETERTNTGHPPRSA